MEKNVSEQTGNRIALVSFVGACLVSLLHLKEIAANSAEQFFLLVARETLGQAAVPFFFAVSGYFLAVHIGEPLWWRRAVFKRIFSLGLPYVFWLLATAGLLYALPSHYWPGWRLFGMDLTRYPVLPPLWYVRCLFILVLVSPILNDLITRFRFVTLAVFFCGTMSVAVCRTFVESGVLEQGGLWGFLAFGVPLSAIFYFSVGICLRKYPTELGGLSRRVLLAVTVVLVGLRVILLKYDWCRFQFACLELTIPFIVASAVVWAPSWRLPNFLRGTAFPIYLIHMTVYFAFWFTPSVSDTHPTLQYVLSIVIPIVVYRLLSRYLPRVSSICFGGR